MNLNTLVNYKHSLFTVKPLDLSGVEIIKSKCFGYTYYAVRDGKLLTILDTTIANDSHSLYRALEGLNKPTANDLAMFAEEWLE